MKFTGGQQKVEVANINLEDYLEDDVINVSKSISGRSRICYMKIARPSALDALLAKRLALQAIEEKENANKVC